MTMPFGLGTLGATVGATVADKNRRDTLRALAIGAALLVALWALTRAGGRRRW